MISVTLDPTVEMHVDAYERAFTGDRHIGLEDFLPKRDDPTYLRVLVELIRVDLELSWAARQGKSLNDYPSLVAELADNPEMRAEVAYEEFRQRRQFGEAVSVDDFAAKYGIATAHWSTVVARSEETRTTLDQFEAASARLPASGQCWRDFELIEEIGRGALSRVMLARQRTLSGRLVVLKFAPKHLLEAEKLARLQHPHIVPVFSVYDDRDFHVFCMPYLGGRTLADRRLQASDATPRSEAEVLGLGAKLSQAISHAHQRGILHNDIKPANILIDDEGQPMLLDFNLAVEMVPTEKIENVGGTFPYMSPESLIGLADGKATADERSDIYSLGVVLFELLTKQQPFTSTDDVQTAVESRREPQRVEKFAVVAPAFASIVNKCLSFDPANRYRAADELYEDITRQSQHRPLRFASNPSLKERSIKWCRRHPRISSLSSMATIAVALLAFAAAAWTARERHIDRLEASAEYTEFRGEFHQLAPQLSAIGLDAVDADASIKAAEQLLARYVRDGAWKDASRYQSLDVVVQREVNAVISRLAFLTAAGHTWLARRGPTQSGSHLAAAMNWNALSRKAANTPRKSHLFQLARLQQLTDQPDAEAALVRARDATPVDADDLQLVGLLAHLDGDSETALVSLRSACEQSSQDYSKWFDLASAYASTGAWSNAESCLTTCLALRPESQLTWYCRALARTKLGNHTGAVADYSRFLATTPDHSYALLNRALAYKAAGDHASALKDLNQAISQGCGGTRVLIIRSRVRRLMGDIRGAKNEMQQAIMSTPQNENDWIARGVATMQRQPAQALEDFRQALILNPQSHAARRNIAHVLSEQLQQVDAAIDCLDSLIADDQSDPAAYGGRGVLLARTGKFEQAMADANRVIELNGGPRTLLQAACIYSLVSAKQPELQATAISLLGDSFKADPKLARLAQNDADLRDIHALEVFQELCKAATTLAEIPTAKSAIADGEK